MNYLGFIWADGMPVPGAMEIMQRDLPGWIEQMDRRGVRLFGRELDLPQTAATVRVVGGETLVTDGPFAETKEFVAGLDLFRCADLDEAIEVAGSSPVCRFHPIEIRPFREAPRLGAQVSAFARGEDGAARPYLLSTWTGATPATPGDDQAMTNESDAWRQHAQARGLHIAGGALADTDAATTIRVDDGETQLSDGPGSTTEAFIAGMDIVSCADRRQAIELAASHPAARYHAIEVRPFYAE